jgi:hypothetical protein
LRAKEKNNSSSLPESCFLIDPLRPKFARLQTTGKTGFRPVETALGRKHFIVLMRRSD